MQHRIALAALIISAVVFSVCGDASELFHSFLLADGDFPGVAPVTGVNTTGAAEGVAE